jgi:hypothetical protein
MQDFLAGDLIPTAFNKRERSVKLQSKKKHAEGLLLDFTLLDTFKGLIRRES